MISDLEVAQDQLLLLFEQHLYIWGELFTSINLPSIEGEYLKVKMDFIGDFNGQFIMLFPEEITNDIMGNFLGLDNNDPLIINLSHMDAAAEIMNILGAHIVSSWLKEKGRYTIGLPIVSVFNNSEQDHFLVGKNITGILIDEKPVFLKIIYK